jgi:hypothetical protein
MKSPTGSALVVVQGVKGSDIMLWHGTVFCYELERQVISFGS